MAKANPRLGSLDVDSATRLQVDPGVAHVPLNDTSSSLDARRKYR